MWHEARKQEKKIKGMIVDYRKRADRRKEFYEKIVSRHVLKCSIDIYTTVVFFSELIQFSSSNFMGGNVKSTMMSPTFRKNRTCEQVESD